MKEYNFIINGNDYHVSIENVNDTTAEVMVNGAAFNVEFSGEGKPKKAKQEKLTQVAPNPNPEPRERAQVAKPAVASAPASGVKSPLPGVILELKVNVGDTVKEGQHLLVLEAMKMENNIDSDRSGVVKSINVTKGDSVLEGDLLLTIE
ncbi:MAG: biotin/lipoyl-binding protein [Alistipes sp.]|nr:biotin/lipoyl-binding protein [Alistipes sp.]